LTFLVLGIMANSDVPWLSHFGAKGIALFAHTMTSDVVMFSQARNGTTTFVA
jgi:hypothetical protein